MRPWIAFKRLYFQLISKYQDFVLFLFGLYFVLKGLIETAPGVQLPQSRFLEAYGEHIEDLYSLVAIGLGLYFIFQHFFRDKAVWYAVTRFNIFIAFLVQLWVVFVTFTADPPYDFFGLMSLLAASILGSIYVYMGVKKDAD